MMKHILFKDTRGYAITPEDNYNAEVSNANKITRFSKFKDKTSVMCYIVNILKLNPELIIDRTGEPNIEIAPITFMP
jgi:hypothetical protein